MSPSVIPCTPSGVVPWPVLTSRFSQVDLPFVDGFGRARHEHRCVVALPFDRQAAAMRLDVDPGVEQAEADADGDRGAGAGAAGQRLAGAALVDAQADRAPRHDLHEAGVDALGEAHVALDA